jgi:pimeloyl-ACP methyl ester carboxylesterase
MPYRIRVTVAILLALLGAAIFAPLIIPIAELDGTVPAEQLAGPDSRFVEVQGRSVHLRESARAADVERPTLLLLHGFGSSLESWRKVIDTLSVFGRTVAVDRVAFGLSEHPERGSWSGTNPYSLEGEAAWTLELMDTLGIESAVLIGSSSGGALAAQVALTRPDRVAGLVLLSPTIFDAGGPPAWSRPLLATPQLNRVGPLFMRQFGGASGENFYRAAWSDPERITAADIEAYRSPLRAEGWDRALWELTRATRRPPVAGRLDEVSAARRSPYSYPTGWWRSSTPAGICLTRSVLSSCWRSSKIGSQGCQWAMSAEQRRRKREKPPLVGGAPVLD